MNTEKLISHFFNSSIQTAKDVFLKLGRLELAQCFILEHSGRITRLPFPLIGNASKNLAAGLIREATSKLNPLALVFITEAWVTMRHIDDPANDEFLEGRKRVSDQPDKTECIMVVQETKEKTTALMIPIVRGGKGVYFGEAIATPDVQGRFTHLL